MLRYLESDVSRALFASPARSQVFAAAASVSEIAGWMAHDAGRDIEARHHLDRSYRLAQAAGSVGADGEHVCFEVASCKPTHPLPEPELTHHSCPERAHAAVASLAGRWC